MGWVESLPYFCAATETSQNIAMDYSDTKIGLILPQKFEKFVQQLKQVGTSLWITAMLKLV
jgi:hypothetical protein